MFWEETAALERGTYEHATEEDFNGFLMLQEALSNLLLVAGVLQMVKVSRLAPYPQCVMPRTLNALCLVPSMYYASYVDATDLVHARECGVMVLCYTRAGLVARMTNSRYRSRFELRPTNLRCKLAGQSIHTYT